jgi:type II secretory pathway pseudopilin PulG
VVGRDRGDTLVELLVSIAIMGIAGVAIFGALLTSVKVSDYHRKQASAGAYVHNFAEALTTFVATGYKQCATKTDYTPATLSYTAPAGFTASTTSVAYWIISSSTWVTTGCTSSNDSGVQQVSIQVASNDGRATESLQVVVRQPCGAGSACT